MLGLLVKQWDEMKVRLGRKSNQKPGRGLKDSKLAEKMQDAGKIQ